jgi:hypothetical protein
MRIAVQATQMLKDSRGPSGRGRRSGGRSSGGGCRHPWRGFEGRGGNGPESSREFAFAGPAAPRPSDDDDVVGGRRVALPG